MSRYFVPIAQPQIRNSLLDFSPVNQGLNAIGEAQQNASRNALLREQMAQQKEQQQWQRGRDQKQDARIDKEWHGKQAMAFLQMPEGPERDAGWKRHVAQNYDPSKLSPEELSSVTGPRLLAAEAGMAIDPLDRQTAQAKLDLLRAETARASRRDQGPESPNSVREWQYFNSLSPDDQRRYLTMKRSEKYLDTGTAFVRPDSVNPSAPPTQVVAKDLQAAEREKKLGQAMGEGIANLPKLKSSFRSQQIADKNLFRSLEKAETLAGPWTTGFAGSMTQYVKGTPSSDLAITLRQVKASLGFASLQQMRDNSPTGGALGQVTERELELLQNAEAALDQAQSEDEFREALTYLREIKTEYAQLRRGAYEADVARFGAAAVPNPETGQKSQGGADLRKKYGLE